MSQADKDNRIRSVRLYMKAGCHLCEEAEAELSRLARRYPHRLERVDITADPGLMARYGERIPVLEIDGREYSAPLSAREIEAALRTMETAELYTVEEAERTRA